MPDPFVKRGRFEIICEILITCQKPLPKTRVMYRCYLNSTQIERYLTFLVSIGLLELVNGTEKRLYRTTSKGTEFLAHYKYVTSLIDRSIS